MRRALAAVAPLVAAVALASCGGGGGSSSSTVASVTAFCDKAKELQQLGSTFQGLSGSSLAEAKSAFGQAEQKLQEIDDVAPSEVKSDADKVLSIFKDINSAVQGASSPQELTSSLQKIAPEVNGLQAPLSHLKSFGRSNCKQ